MFCYYPLLFSNVEKLAAKVGIIPHSSNFWNEKSKKSSDFLDSSPISFIFAQIINC